MTLAQKNLVFITGVEGSGTTMLSKWLRQLPHVACLTQSSPSASHIVQAQLLNDLSLKLWDGEAPPEVADREALLQQIRDIPLENAVSHVVWKRSTPFGMPRYMPILNDLLGLTTRVRCIVMKRPPISCAASILRREMVGSPNEACVRIRAAVTHMAGQLQTSTEISKLVIPYDDLIADPVPWAEQLEDWLGYPSGSLAHVAEMVGRPTAAAEQLRDIYHAEFSAALSDLQYV